MQRQQQRQCLFREQQEQSRDVRVPADIQDQDACLPESETPCFPIREIVLKSEVSTFDWAVHAADIPGDHLLALNDLFYVSFNHDLGGGGASERGTHGHTLFSLPWGCWMLAATSSASGYHQAVAGSSQTYLF